jgi:acetoin utilization protein AcuB
MYVSRYMTPNPITVRPDILIPEARQLLRSHHFRHLPVTGADGRLVGMVTDRDIRSAYPSTILSDAEGKKELERVAKTPVSRIMSPDPVSLYPHSTLDDALVILQKQNVGALPVVDEERVVAGVFSIRDLMRAYSELFGLGERGSRLVAIEDDGGAALLERIVKVLEAGEIPFTRLVKASESPDGKSQGAVFVRVQTCNMTKIRNAFEAAGLKLAGLGAPAARV